MTCFKCGHKADSLTLVEYLNGEKVDLCPKCIEKRAAFAKENNIVRKFRPKFIQDMLAAKEQ